MTYPIDPNGRHYLYVVRTEEALRRWKADRAYYDLLFVPGDSERNTHTEQLLRQAYIAYRSAIMSAWAAYSEGVPTMEPPREVQRVMDEIAREVKEKK